MKNFVLIWAFCLGLYTTSSPGADDFVSWHAAGSPGWDVVFPVGKANLVYRDIRWAIVIERVQCDGVDIVPENLGQRADADWGIVDTGGAEWIYSWPSGRIDTAIWYDEKLAKLRYVSYAIPVWAQRVSIWYTVRFPGGVRSSLKRTRSFEIHSWPLAGNPPSSVLVPDEQVGDLPDTASKDAVEPIARELPPELKKVRQSTLNGHPAAIDPASPKP